MNDVVAGALARVLIALLVLVGVSLLVHAAMVRRQRTGISSALEPYTLEPPQPKPEARHFTMAETTLTRRAVELTARLLRPSRLLPTVERLLEQADWPIRGAEALFFYAAGAAVLTVLGGSIGGLGATVLALLVAAVAPIGALGLAISRRRRAFEAQLPDALQMLAGSLRAGRSLLQALQGLANETADPVASELSRTLAQARLGRSTEDALEEMARRMASEDAQFVASAVRMQRQVGGNLADLLGVLAETMVERARLRGDVKALTAEGRISAIVLGILPIGLGVFMYVVDRDYVSVLFHDPLGQLMVAGAGVLAAGGFFWMKKTMEVDI